MLIRTEIINRNARPFYWAFNRATRHPTVPMLNQLQRSVQGSMAYGLAAS